MSENDGYIRATRNPPFVEINQVRQRRPGPAWSGSIPFKVMAESWGPREEEWIVQGMLGGLTKMTTAEILECPLADYTEKKIKETAR